MDTFNIVDFQEAYEVLKPIVEHTPLLKTKLHTNVLLKAENLQRSGSFKLRGASYKISGLSKEEKALGVICASAGNHAQGVAIACLQYGIKCSIVMPKTAPLAKVNATKAYQAEVILQGDSFDDAYMYAKYLQSITNQVFIEPFDDLEVIKGQGSIAFELLEKTPNLTTVLVPIGGGGLISGVAYVLKQLKPSIKVIGVQAINANNLPCLTSELRPEKLVTSETVADGIAVKQIGSINYQFIKNYVDEIITIEEDEIAATMLYLLEELKMVSEGAGAISYAPIFFNKYQIQADEQVVCIVSGGNIDVNIMAKIIDLGLYKTGRKATLSVEMVDKPGQLVKLLDIISKENANIINIEHKRSLLKNHIVHVKVLVLIECNNQEHLELIVDKLAFNQMNANIEK